MNSDAEFTEYEPDAMNQPTQALARQERQPVGLQALGEIETMQRQMAQSNERITMVHSFVADNFLAGTDFGKSYASADKDTLLKPGAEKVCKIANTSFRFRKDVETYSMLGKHADGTICYVCEIIDNRTGAIVGEGRGAATIGDKKRDVNKSIKNAEKCALVDAALFTFSLSSMFTQDMPTKRNKLDTAMKELWEAICEERVGVESSMSNSKFFESVATQFCHGKPKTLGAVNAMRKAVIDDGLFDLATGERIKG